MIISGLKGSKLASLSRRVVLLGWLLWCTDLGWTQTGPMEAVVARVMRHADVDEPERGNFVLNIERGYDALLLRVHLIRQARRSIDLQTFIWKNDESGRLMIYELIEAARRGVKVRVIADHMVSEKNPEIGAFLATVHPNFEVRHYRPVLERLNPSMLETILSGLFSFHGINQRMHNKLMVFDDAVMLTGGRNIENSYFDFATGMNFRDHDVLAVGPVSQLAAESFDDFWEYRHTIPSLRLVDVNQAVREGDYPRYEKWEDYDFGGLFTTLSSQADKSELMKSYFWERLLAVKKVEFVHDNPGKGRGFFSKDSKTTKAMRKRIGKAQEEVLVQSPYLILSKTARKMVQKMRKNHPDLRISVSTNSYASTDNIMAYSANYRLRGDYVEKLGLHVYEYKPHPEVLSELVPRFDALVERAREENLQNEPFLCIHAKSFVVDRRVSFIGSYNLDPRSVSLNTEVGLIIEDEAFAQRLRAEIQRDILPENSWVIARKEFPLGLNKVNYLVRDVLSISPVDIWPVQNTSSFELKEGYEPVPPDAPEFYEHYHDIGGFPGSDGLLTTKDILTRIYKTVGAPFTPVM